MRTLPKLFMGLFLASLIGNPCNVLAQGTISTIARPSTSVRNILHGRQARPRANTYYLLALAAARKGRIAQALSTIKTGFQIEPTNIRLLNLRAALWARQGRIRDAIREFRRVLQLEPDNTYARTAMRLMQKSVRRPAVVVKQFPSQTKDSVAPVAPVNAPMAATPEKVLKSSYFEQAKQKQRCYYQMAALYRAQKSLEISDSSQKDKFNPDILVEKKFLAAIPICPGSGKYTWKEGAPLCSIHGSFKDVEAEVKTVFLDFNRGLRAKLGGNLQKAISAFQQVVVLYPNWSEAYYQLADTYFRNGQNTQASHAVRDSLRHAPQNLDAKLLLAHIYYKTGHKDSALKLLDEVTETTSGTIYGLASRSLASAIRSGRTYLDLFPPDK